MKGFRNSLNMFVVYLLVASYIPIVVAAAPVQQLPGNLITYVSDDHDLQPDQATQLAKYQLAATTEEVRLIRIDPNMLLTRTFAANDADPIPLTLNLERGGNIPLSPPQITRNGLRAYTWNSKQVATNSSTTIAVQDDKVVGTIHSNGELYQIRPVGGGLQALILVDQSALPPEEPPSTVPSIRPTTTGDLPNPSASGIEDNGSEITLLVAYTPAAETRTAGAMNAVINLAIDETNQSYRNSNIPLSIRLVHAHKVNFTETVSIQTDLDALAFADDGIMDEVHNLRDEYAADIVVLIVGNRKDYCGMADAIMASAATAFAVVEEACATGLYTFGHEIGHLQGARHDRAKDPSVEPFAYGHGYVYENPTTQESWRTMMAYHSCKVVITCTRMAYWSNPNVAFSNIPMGTAQEDNARVLKETAYRVANFRVQQAAGNFDGRWLTNFAEINFQQTGNRLVGKYVRYGDSKEYSLQGIVTGRHFEGFYHNDPTKRAFFDLSVNGKSIQGGWLWSSDNSFHDWCGVREGALPEGCGFSGKWNLKGSFSASGSNKGPYIGTLTQVGRQLQGTYKDEEGNDVVVDGQLGAEGPGKHYRASGNREWFRNGKRIGSGTFIWELADFNNTQFRGLVVYQVARRERCGSRIGVPAPLTCRLT